MTFPDITRWVHGKTKYFEGRATQWVASKWSMYLLACKKDRVLTKLFKVPFIDILGTSEKHLTERTGSIPAIKKLKQFAKEFEFRNLH